MDRVEIWHNGLEALVRPVVDVDPEELARKN